MNTHAEKKHVNKSQSVSNELTQMKRGDESTFQFVDNRPETVAQRNLQEVAEYSPRAEQAVQLQAKANTLSIQQEQIAQLAGIEKGKWVSDGEIHYRNLSDEFYPTFGFVTKVEDKGYTNPTDNRKNVISPVWLALWNEYDQLWSAASAIHNYANANRTLYGAAHEWESFAVGTPLYDKRLEIIAAGGFLTKGQQGPGPIPMVDHPEEILVDNFIARALAAYAVWMAGVKTKQNRGPKDPQGLSKLGLKILKARVLPQNWTFHPSESGTWALHRSGNQNTPEDPDAPNGRMTFIYHV